MFEKLKRKEDKFKVETEYKETRFEVQKKRKIKNIGDDIMAAKSGRIDEDKEDMQGDYEHESNTSKSDASVEELITEEMFQKALQATLQRGKF